MESNVLTIGAASCSRALRGLSPPEGALTQLRRDQRSSHGKSAATGGWSTSWQRGVKPSAEEVVVRRRMPKGESHSRNLVVEDFLLGLENLSVWVCDSLFLENLAKYTFD